MPAHVLVLEDQAGLLVPITATRVDLHSMSPHEGATTVTLHLQTPHATSLRVKGVFAPPNFCMDEDGEPLTDFDVSPVVEGQEYTIEFSLASRMSTSIALRWSVPFAPVGEVGDSPGDGRRVAYMLPAVVGQTQYNSYIDWGAVVLQLDFVNSSSRRLIESTIADGAVLGFTTKVADGSDPVALIVTVRRLGDGGGKGESKTERSKFFTSLLMCGVVLLFAFGFGGVFGKRPNEKPRIPM